MSSNEEWSPSVKESCARRRSTRLSRQSENPKKRPGSSEKKSPKTSAKKKKASPKAKEEIPGNSINTLLTKQELEILFEKWARDRHYRASSPPTTQASLVVSTTSDGKNVTTNISCYKNNEFFLREIASNLVGPSAIAGPSNFETIASSVSFSTPITAALKTSPAEDKKPSSTETAPKTPTIVHSTSSPGILNPPQKTLNDQKNFLQIPPSGFTTPRRFDQSQTARRNPPFYPNLNPWNLPAASNSTMNNENHAIDSGTFVSGGNNVQNRYASETSGNVLHGNFNRNFQRDDRYNCVNPQNSSVVQNRFSNNDAENVLHGNFNRNFQRDDRNNCGNLNSQSSFPLQNRNDAGNSLNNWNSMFQMGLNNFKINQSMNPNDSAYIFSANSAGIITDNSYNSPSISSWNSEQYNRNNYWNGGNLYNNMYGNENSTGVQQFNKENFPANGKVGNENSAIFNNPESYYNNLPEIKNIDKDLALLDDKQPIFRDNESSSSSFDDDIQYENCFENLTSTNENAVSTTLNDEILPSFFIKSEIIAQSSGETDCFQYNNDSLPETIRQNFVRRNFDRQKDAESSSSSSRFDMLRKNTTIKDC